MDYHYADDQIFDCPSPNRIWSPLDCESSCWLCGFVDRHRPACPIELAATSFERCASHLEGRNEACVSCACERCHPMLAIEGIGEPEEEEELAETWEFYFDRCVTNECPACSVDGGL